MDAVAGVEMATKSKFRLRYSNLAASILGLYIYRHNIKSEYVDNNRRDVRLRIHHRVHQERSWQSQL